MKKLALFCFVLCFSWQVFWWGLGLAEARTTFRYPLTPSGTYVTAYYDDDRNSGTTRDWGGGKKTYDQHSGNDYGVGSWTGMDKGFWIVAAADGVVEAAVDGHADRCSSGSCSPGNGNYVKLRHPDGLTTFYLHMKKGTVQVKSGQNVKCGQNLGQVGSSGYSTGPHLHFQVNSGSSHRNPYLAGDWVDRGAYLSLPSTQCQGGTSNPPPTKCDYVKTANLGGVNLNIRSGASTSNSVVGSIPEGVCLQVLASTTGQNISGNTTWYKIKYNNVEGWISGYYTVCSDCGGPAPECTNGATRACYTGPSDTRNKGLCRDGTQTCSSGKWGACSGDVKPSTEVCDGKDNNCNGQIDEGNPGGGASCNTGKPGVCDAGTLQCENGKLVCKQTTSSSPEKCDGKDNNCDGQIDEGNPEGGQACKTGKQGICSDGVTRCNNGKLQCDPIHSPSPEICDGKDNDCNGLIDDGLERPCYNGQPGTNGVGICKGGMQICINGAWGTCQGEVLPATQEICGNGKDDDCNGLVDDGCGAPDKCTSGQSRACYKGPSGTNGVGICRAGIQQCVNGTWGPCQGEILPAAQEICGNQLDDNCNGAVDEGCGSDTCTNGQSRTCYTGPPGTSGVGICRAGTQTCTNNTWGLCEGQILPATQESCGNKLDDDCNGLVDDGCDVPQEGCTDKDGDGYGVGSGCKGAIDCDDNNPHIYPGAPEICGNDLDENCSGKDLSCGQLQVGDEGCKKPEDCESKLCVQIGETQRCSIPCKTSEDCPPGFTCIQEQACWPVAKRRIPPSDFAIPCQVDLQCPEGQRCDGMFCTTAAKGCGCNASISSNSPLTPIILLLLALLCVRRLRWIS